MPDRVWAELAADNGERGRFDLEGWLATRADDQFAVAAITVAELSCGVEGHR
jgi:hypothetical protein